ncbi:MAG TPA: sugar phosphate isomerase/epimerase [Opitutus sp.]|nr:sugar phosphate isomerase/epimerase [Opitutus sp.]
MKSIPVALQLWSVRDDLKRDFAATAAEIARIGYTGVELAGYGSLDAAGAHAALASAQLAVAGMHVGIAALRSDPDKVVAEARLFGTRHVIVPWWPAEEFVSRAAVEKIAEELNEIGARLRASGLQLSYHNHAGEFKLLEDHPVFDWLLGAAEPRNLAAEVDVYWAHVAGYRPEKFLRDHGARVKLIHLKDEAEIGGGPVDFPAVFAAIDAIGAAEWLVVEQEKYHHPPLASVRLCFEQLKRWGRA